MTVLRRAVEDDDRGLDERTGGGEAARVACRFRCHPYHPNDRICDLCKATVHKLETSGHERNHRWQAEWEDEVEQLQVQVEHLRAEFEQIRGQWETVERLVAPGVSHMLGMMGEDNHASG